MVLHHRHFHHNFPGFHHHNFPGFHHNFPGFHHHNFPGFHHHNFLVSTTIISLVSTTIISLVSTAGIVTTSKNLLLLCFIFANLLFSVCRRALFQSLGRRFLLFLIITSIPFQRAFLHCSFKITDHIFHFWIFFSK